MNARVSGPARVTFDDVDVSRFLSADGLNIERGDPAGVPTWEQKLQAAIGRQRDLIRAAASLYGDALGDSLLRALDDVADASDNLSAATTGLRREGDQAADLARKLLAEQDELAKVLDLQTLQIAHVKRYGYGAEDRSDYPTLASAADYAQGERVRLHGELMKAQESIEAMSGEQDRAVEAACSQVLAYDAELDRLQAQGAITGQRRWAIIRAAEKAYREAVAR